jgi:predicted O-linked N-acetylglucosamine transferase (SPINDLY family)
MGAPVVSRAGDRHASRVGASLLNAVGLSALVASSDEELIEIAVGLANDRDKLAELRLGMRERMADSPLTDAADYAREMQRLFREIWIRWCQTPVPQP